MTRALVILALLLQPLIAGLSLRIADGPVSVAERDISSCCPLCPSMDGCGCGCAIAPEHDPVPQTPGVPAPARDTLVAVPSAERPGRPFESVAIERPARRGAPGADERARPATAREAMTFLCVWTT